MRIIPEGSCKCNFEFAVFFYSRFCRYFLQPVPNGTGCGMRGLFINPSFHSAMDFRFQRSGIRFFRRSLVFGGQRLEAFHHHDNAKGKDQDSKHQLQ